MRMRLRHCRRSGRRRCTASEIGSLKGKGALWISLCRTTFRGCSTRSTRSSKARSSRWNARTCSTSTSAANTRAPTGTTAESRRGHGKTCSARCAGVPTTPAGCATACPPNWAVAMAARGLGLHNDLQDESSIVGNFPQVIMMERFGTETQRTQWSEAMLRGERGFAFGLTEPAHGSDATWMETHAERGGDGWVINGAKRFNTGVHRATHDLVFARTSGEPGQALGITAFLVPSDAPGFTVPYYWWTFNMPSDHGEVELHDVTVPDDAVLGEVDRGLEVAQTFLHENRIRQAASSLGAAQYCIDRAVAYAGDRVVVGKPLSVHQAIQWAPGGVQTEAHMW